MLAEVLTFSLLGGVAVLGHVYRVFTNRTSFSKKLLETTVFGTAPAVVGIVLGAEPASASEAPHAAFLAFSSLFIVVLLVRYALPSALVGTRHLLIDFGTTLFLVGVSVSVAVSEPGDAIVPFCLVYVAVYYLWVNDADDDFWATSDKSPVHAYAVVGQSDSADLDTDRA